MSFHKVTSKEQTFSQQESHALKSDIQISITFLLSNTCLHPAVFSPTFMATDRHGSNPYGFLYITNRHKLLRLFSAKWDKIKGLKIVIERERTSKQLWLVQTLSVNSLVDIYEKEVTGCEMAKNESGTSGNQMSKRIFIFIYLHKMTSAFIPYPTAFPYGNGMVLHFYQQQESSTTKTVYKVINKRLKTYV